MRSWEDIPHTALPRYMEAVRRIGERDPRLRIITVRAEAGGFLRLQRENPGAHILSARVTRKDRVFYTDKGGRVRLLDFSVRGDNRYYTAEA